MNNLAKEWEEIDQFFHRSNLQFESQAKKIAMTASTREYISLINFLDKIQFVYYDYYGIKSELEQLHTQHLEYFRLALLAAMSSNKRTICKNSNFPLHAELVQDNLIENVKILLFQLDMLIKNVRLERVKGNLAKTNILFFNSKQIWNLTILQDGTQDYTRNDYLFVKKVFKQSSSASQPSSI